MHLRRFIPTPSMAVAVVALVVSATGVTWAATSLPRNSVGSAQVINGSVRGIDIRNGSVGRRDIRNGAVNSRKVANDSITGADIVESTLARVPSAIVADRAGEAARAVNATSAGDASTLDGLNSSAFTRSSQVRPFKVALSFGQKVEFLSNGPIGLEADCRENVGAQGQDELRLLAVTRAEGSFMQGDTPHSGPGVGSDFLTPATPEDNRTMGGVVTTQAGEGQPAAEDDIDTGFVAGPNGEYIGIDETTMYGVNVGNSDCLLVGLATIL